MDSGGRNPGIVQPVLGPGTDGWYDRTKSANDNADLVYQRPWSDPQDRLTTQALAANTAPGQVLADEVRPPFPNPLFPPRYGYRTRQLGVQDMIDINQEYLPPFRDYSGTPAGYQGASRNSSGNGSW